MTTPWAANKRNQLIYGPIYEAALDSAVKLSYDPSTTEITTTLGHLLIPTMEPGTNFYTAADVHVPELMIPDEVEALADDIQILKPTIVRVYDNDESCRIADEIAYANIL